MGGTAGTFYRQFGMTMAIAIGLSALNALTLSPALCAILLKPHKKEDGTEDSTLKERMKVAYTAAHYCYSRYDFRFLQSQSGGYRNLCTS